MGIWKYRAITKTKNSETLEHTTKELGIERFFLSKTIRKQTIAATFNNFVPGTTTAYYNKGNITLEIKTDY